MRKQSRRRSDVPRGGRLAAAGLDQAKIGAVRRLAYERPIFGLLSACLAAGIRRVKGVKKIGVRLGNWFPATPGKRTASRPTQWVSEDRERRPRSNSTKDKRHDRRNHEMGER
jgi:hypothetical protein